MHFFTFIPILLGLLIVVQSTLNRQIAFNYGLSSGVFINATVFFILSFGMFIVAKLYPSYMSEFLSAKPWNSEFKIWYLIPGLCGFFFVLGLPYAIHEIGASKSFVLLVSAQTVFGFCYDLYFSGKEFSLVKISGALLSLAGALLVML